MQRSNRRGGSSNRSRNSNSNFKRRSRSGGNSGGYKANRGGRSNDGYKANRGGGRGRRGGRRQGGFNQATFDPTPVIIQSKQQSSVAAEVKHQIENAFSDFAVHPQLKSNIAERGYIAPTPIQDQVIPHILQGRDVVGIANTGTGKTAAFLIPLLNKVVSNTDERVLIIAPTRELALQIRDELMSFSQQLNIFATVVIGGAKIDRQIRSLRKDPQFVIGTPGRIKDLNQRRKLDYGQFGSIVLDEVDRMLDMGFVHEIRAIINQLPAERHSLFFSATMDDRVRDIMRGFLRDPVSISVKTQDTSTNIEQDIVEIRGRSKVQVLDSMLRQQEFEKVLVFGRTKHGMNNLSRKLKEQGHRVSAIHGNKTQNQRQKTLQQFRDDKIQVLVATDVVARGLDVDNITHVINYDLPESHADYIHRIGRTGRANKKGVALTFIE